MQASTRNADPAELAKFAALAQSWWDPKGPSKPLHDLNPLRLRLRGARGRRSPASAVLDVGCGGGILSEAMARGGARVLGIDLSQAVLDVAELHALEGKHRRRVSRRRGRRTGAGTARRLRSGDLHGNARARSRSWRRRQGSGRAGETRRRRHRLHAQPQSARHSRWPSSARNTSPRVLPRGTHEYLKFIRPSELARWGRRPVWNCATCAASPTIRCRARFGSRRTPASTTWRISPGPSPHDAALASDAERRRPRMSDAMTWLAAAIGIAVGALAALLWRARREQSLRVETELLRARLKSEESLSAEREQALARAREQLQGVFGDLARDSLQSNSELFLQLARERLDPAAIGRLAGAQGTGDGDRIPGAAHSRGARQDRGADPGHRARAHRFFRHHQDSDGVAGERPESRCRARRATW